MSHTERDRLIYESAKEKRENPTRSEAKMLEILNNQVGTRYPYVFQFVELPYILDFYFQTLGICIEVDDDGHFAHRKQDIKRDAFLLERKGIVTYRFSNSDVKYNPQVADLIRKLLDIKMIFKSDSKRPNYCPACGMTIRTEFNFCQGCGRPI
jgi:very-short-patch-repair endonuclease